MTTLRPRSWLVFAALIATVALAGLLAANALVTARSHRSVAEGVLGDYAEFAAAELGNRIRTALAQRLYPIAASVGGLGEGSGPPLDLRAVAARADPEVWAMIAAGAGTVRTGPGLIEIAAPGPTAGLEARLADTLAGHARLVRERRGYLTLLWLPDADDRFAALVVAPGRSSDSLARVAGLLLRAEAFGALLAQPLGRAPLLPPSLTGGTRLDSVVSYRVTTPGGRLVLHSPAPPAGSFRAVDTLDPIWGGLRLEVALDPSLAGRLVIGGLPRSRLPVVLGLLGLTVLLVGIAGRQLRSERELARQRDEFVAGVSHELRTPLAQIRLFTETLRLERIRSDRERSRAVEIIDRESLRLTQLVENLLAVSRAGRGALTLDVGDRDLALLLREALDGFEPIARERGATLAIDAPPALPARVDGEAFRRVVLNLVDNAVKYGPPRQTVTVALERGDGMVRLMVTDQGPGIPPAERRRVFERFVRGAAGGGGPTGTGLGLALVRELVELHGGRVAIGDGPGGGARVAVELPAGEER